LYASYAVGQKEPNRDDFEAGTTFQPDPEILQDVELGLERKGNGYSFSANFYYMFYKDQLVLSGQINDVGAYTRVNAASSFRRGVELQGTKRFTNWLQASANIALSQNRISRFIEFIDDYDTGGQQQVAHINTPISFSPGVIGGYTVELLPLKRFNLAFTGKYVGRQYLDNTGDVRRSLDPYFTQDARLMLTIPNRVFSNLQLVVQANNIFEELYEPNGYTFSYYYLNRLITENYYFPMAGRNFMVALNLKL
jgi:iron complex outermembrane recepter protein